MTWKPRLEASMTSPQARDAGTLDPPGLARQQGLRRPCERSARRGELMDPRRAGRELSVHHRGGPRMDDQLATPAVNTGALLELRPWG